MKNDDKQHNLPKFKTNRYYFTSVNCHKNYSVSMKSCQLTILFSSRSLCAPPLNVTARVDEHSSV